MAHPDLVPVARKPFDDLLGPAPHQKHRIPEHPVTAGTLLDFTVEGGQITEAGLRNNISVGLQYLAAWLEGSGAVGIFNLMEDAATAEISRSQVWQWLHHKEAVLNDGRKVTAGLLNTLFDEEVKTLRQVSADRTRFDIAARLFHQLVMVEDFTEFLTLEAYPFLI